MLIPRAQERGEALLERRSDAPPEAFGRGARSTEGRERVLKAFGYAGKGIGQRAVKIDEQVHVADPNA